MALNGLFCADVPLRNYSLTNAVQLPRASGTDKKPGLAMFAVGA